MYDNPTEKGKRLKVGDTLATRWGELEIERLLVCPTPTSDPAGEETGVEVEVVELAHVTAVVELEGEHWIYGIEATKRVLPDA